MDEAWRMKHVQEVSWMTGMSATGFGFDQALFGTAIGVMREQLWYTSR
jgi:hypothetical protein